MRITVLLSILLAVTGCSDFPDLDAAVSARARAADYPAILPLDGLLASVPEIEPGLGVGDLPQRVHRLQGRAANLRGRAVVDAGTRARMNAALARHL